MLISIKLYRPYDRYPDDHFYGDPFDAKIDSFIGGAQSWSSPREDRTRTPLAIIGKPEIAVELHEDGPLFDFIINQVDQIPNYISAIATIVSAWIITRKLRKENLPADDFNGQSGTRIVVGDLQIESRANLNVDEIQKLTTTLVQIHQQRVPAQESKRIKVLFLAANPASTHKLQLDEEARAISKMIRASEHRDDLEFITAWAVRPDDMIQLLNEHQPNVVHFSGHGSPSEEIILQDNLGNAQPISKAALVSLFQTMKDNIQIVVLNACFSRPQGEAISQTIDCVIGMAKEIGDRAAITFASSFYRAICFGRSVEQALGQGRTSLLLEGIGEESTPTLILRQGVDASSLILLR